MKYSCKQIFTINNDKESALRCVQTKVVLVPKIQKRGQSTGFTDILFH